MVRLGGPPAYPALIAEFVRRYNSDKTRREYASGSGGPRPRDAPRSVPHRRREAGGAHYFDLLDIQKVLGHANPATTMRSYLDSLDTGVIERASSVLD